jgi:serine/threonine-protein kinase
MRRVALKVLAEEAMDDVAIARLEREGRAALAIEHENVCMTIDYGLLADNRPYVAMELLEGESLRSYLQRRGKLDFDEAIEISLQMLAGLEAVHRRGIVHRDIKPENVFIAWDRKLQNPTVKLLDFGNCRSLKDPLDGRTLTMTGCVVGTPGYLAPERAFGARAADPRVDLFAVGLIMFEMLAGRPAFQGKTTAELALDFASRLPPLRTLRYVPAALERIVARATEQEPSLRYASAADFVRDLVEGRAILLRDAGRSEAPPSTKRSQPPRTPTAASSATTNTRSTRAQASGWEKGTQHLAAAKRSLVGAR